MRRGGCGATEPTARGPPAVSPGTATCEGSIFAYSGDLFFSHPQAKSRERMTIRVSRTNGDSWSSDDQLLVHEGPSAYSCLGSTAKGELAVLWECDGKDLCLATTTFFK